MSLVLALKEGDNIYFSAESSISTNRAFRDSMTTTSSRKIISFSQHGIDVLIGMTGVGSISIYLDHLANRITDYIESLQSQNDVLKVKPDLVKLSNVDIFNIVYEWYSTMVPPVLKKSSNNDEASKDDRLKVNLLIGIRHTKVCQLFSVTSNYDVTELYEFGCIGICTEAATVAYELIRNTDLYPQNEKLLNRIIQACSMYYNGLNDDIYSINIQDMEFEHA